MALASVTRFWLKGIPVRRGDLSSVWKGNMVCFTLLGFLVYFGYVRLSVLHVWNSVFHRGKTDSLTGVRQRGMVRWAWQGWLRMWFPVAENFNNPPQIISGFAIPPFFYPSFVEPMYTSSLGYVWWCRDAASHVSTGMHGAVDSTSETLLHINTIEQASLFF